jgi:hypothetical protein
VKIQPDPVIAYYISSHGYGHGVRSCDIIRALNVLYPQISVQIVSELPQAFFGTLTKSARNTIRALSFDVGMIQLDSIRVDVDATLEKIEQLCSCRKQLLDQESDYLNRNGIALVVADIPAIPLEAAALLGIPTIAVGNFAWDWIYSAFAARDKRWEQIVHIFREQYAKTDLLLRMPFCEEMRAFRHIEDIPIVASPGRMRRSIISDLTGCDSNKKWILLSFTTLDWNDDTLANVETIEDYEFLTVSPLIWKRKNIYSIDREAIPFSDVIASADAVISKPGFGILSDCAVNEKPLIYSDRADFLEYGILVKAIRKYLKHIHITANDLYRGNLLPSLHRIWNCPPPAETPPQGGAVIAAQHIAQFLNLA